MSRFWDASGDWSFHNAFHCPSSHKASGISLYPSLVSKERAKEKALFEVLMRFATVGFARAFYAFPCLFNLVKTEHHPVCEKPTWI